MLASSLLCRPLCFPNPPVVCMNGAYSLGQSSYVTPPNPLGPYAADVVVVIEQSQLLGQAFGIIRGFLEDIEAELVSRSLGTSPEAPNMYTLVGFGGDVGSVHECGNYLQSDTSTTPPTTAFTLDRISQALEAAPLSRQVTSKDGYQAMLVALESPGIRHSPNIAHNLIFIGNSSRTDSCGASSDAKEKVCFPSSCLEVCIDLL